ncbi:SIR2-like domain-containing protein [Chitinophaga rupis]|uniref:SIR2-like domain-containing protein n=1 Tax=Chitinophaga rupis TaxID=573321 RepID=A0A1H7RQU3_9BACT|nr:SIR2 family protein [Chitinophaga rupis]SEL62388.1 SIR2-like domain-containing protein [Chitinophaga rupis]
MESDYSKALEELQQKLKNRNVSVLVGAGFSKNVHNTLFPSWWQLLEKMVIRMNGRSYALDYERLTGRKANETSRKYLTYLKDQVNQYIEQTGYLQVVSNYIQKMGYRETVDIYIEENTPVAIREEGNIFLKYMEDGQIKKALISEADLEMHTKLIKLPWNNIYTTNYDNLLEFCIDEKVFEELDKQLKRYNEEIQSLRIQVLEKKTAIETIEALEMGAQSQDYPAQQPYTNLQDDSALSESDISGAMPRDNTAQKNQLRFEIITANNSMDNLVQKIGNLGEAINECYNIVKHSSDLAIKRNRNIIKLHGSLPKDEKTPFAFDNEYDKRYIISGEDYANYPQRHEAFTQLMRISLLQGQFCLIGFSGDDPNFLAWVSWIRTVVMRDPDEKKEEAKIYLIDARAKTPADSHKQQFYKNHRVVHIPLSHPSCVHFLEKVSGSAIDVDNTRDLLSRLLDYFGDIPVTDIPQLSYELLARQRYEQYIDQLHSNSKDIDMEVVSELCMQYNELKVLKQFNRIPPANRLNNDSRIDFLSSVNALFEEVKKAHPSLSKHFLGLTALLLEDTFIPYSAIIEEGSFQQLQAHAQVLSDDIYYDFLKLALKDAIWKGDNGLCQEIHNKCCQLGLKQYEEEKTLLLIMEAAITFNFGKLRALLEEGGTTKNNPIAFAGYWGMLDREAGIKYLSTQTFGLFQESLYALQMKRMLNGVHYDNQLFEKESRLKQQGLASINEIPDMVFSLTGEPKEKITPYETNDFIGRSIHFGRDDKIVWSLKLLGMMMETGFPFAMQSIRFKAEEAAYSVFRPVVNQFPIPVLYFSLQYHNSKFAKRIGQDYAYEAGLQEKAPVIFDRLAAAYLDSCTPYLYKDNILVFLAQFIVILGPDNWQPFFSTVWQTWKSTGILFNRERHVNADFIESAIRYCQDAHVMATVLQDCIIASLRGGLSLDNATQYLYVLANNPFHQHLKASGLKGEQARIVQQLIALIPENPDYLFILGNIHTFLTDENTVSIVNMLLELDYSRINSPNTWSVAVHYSKRNTFLQRKIVDSLLKSPQLWKTGIFINKDGRRSWSSDNHFIRLRRLRKATGSDNGLTFTATDILDIYHQLKSKLGELKDVNMERIDDFFPLLQEMHWFLDAESVLLGEQDDFQQIRRRVEELSVKEGNVRNIMTGLASDETADINEAITEVARDLYDKENFDVHQLHIRLIISKIQLKRSAGIILCMRYLVQWCEAFKENDFFKSLQNELLGILNLYKYTYPPELAIDVVEELLVRLAIVLQYWGIEHEDVAYFLSLLDSSRFNNVRYNLKEKVKRKELHD